jgi:hypothetical protein
MISGRRFSTWSGFLSASSRTTWQAPIWVHHFSWGIIRLKVQVISAASRTAFVLVAQLVEYSLEQWHDKGFDKNVVGVHSVFLF